MKLGPIPDHLREAVRRRIDEEGQTLPGHDMVALLLHGWPIGGTYLDAEGEVWDWSAQDESTIRIKDGPRKIGDIVIASERFAELREWLPSRPADAVSCHACQGTGCFPPPLQKMLCDKCSGLGWVLRT